MEHTPILETAANTLAPYFAEKLREVTPAMFSESVKMAGETWASHFGPLLQKYDAFICPTTTCQEIPAEMKAWETISVNGREMDLHDTTMTILFNMFSRCPVLAVPSGTTSSGMPTGIQIVGPPFDEFYRGLLASESRHFSDYLALARASSDGRGEEWLNERIDRVRTVENRLIADPDTQVRFHSGPPA